MQTLKDEIEALKQAEPPKDYTVDMVKEWLQSIKDAPDEKAVHLLIARIEAKREKDNTDFNIESTLKPVLENMVAGERNIVYQQLFESVLIYHAAFVR